MPKFNQVTIVGLGLIGGSLGLALRRRRLAREVIGLSRRAATVRQAIRRGAIDRGTTDARRAVQDADLVVLAAPVDAIAPQAVRLARFMRPGSILTDVGSTKARIVRALERALPRHVAFVGGHPLAGSEQRGLQAATPRLFDGSVCILTPDRRTDRAALRRVAAFWKPLVGRVVIMDPRRHDRLLAQTSHVSHALAYCLALSVEADGSASLPPSFLDATRVAKSDPDLWDDIFLTNRAEILRAMARFETGWRGLRRLLARSDRAGLRRFLAAAKARRDALEP